MVEAPTRDAPAAWSGVHARLLKTPPGNLRAEPVRFVGGELTTDYDWGGILLGLDYRHPEKAVVIQKDDVVMLWERTADPETEIQRLRAIRITGAATWLLLRPGTDPASELFVNVDGALCCSTAQAVRVTHAAARHGLLLPVVACDQRGWLDKFEAAIRTEPTSPYVPLAIATA